MEIFNKWVNMRQIVILNKNDFLKMNSLIFLAINNNIFVSF